MKYPLIKGGQGRSPDDLIGSAITIIWLVGLAVLFSIAYYIWKVSI